MRPIAAPVLALCLAASTLRAADDDGFAPLFNGKDLSGWAPCNIAPETFSVRDGMMVTTGAPVGLLIRNVDTQDIHIDQYRQVKDVIRPGHAELPFFMKFGEHTDWCGAGRASGRS